MKTTATQHLLATATRLLDPDAVVAAVPATAAATLAHGLPGTALLHARLATVDQEFAAAATRHWTAASTHAKNQPPASGAYHTTGGLAASLIIGTSYLPDPERHQPAAARGARWLSACAVDLADHYRGHRDAVAWGTPWHVYDTITGLTGIGRVLLAAVQTGHSEAEPGLLAALHALTDILINRIGDRPGWWLAADQHPSAVRAHPSGAASTGVAHGVAGPLALLSIAHLTGYTLTGQQTAISDAATWLLRWRADDGTWPPHITGQELDSGVPDPAPGRRDAWCYGTPGISRSLHLAGQATHDPTFDATATSAVHDLGGRPCHRWDVAGPTICHGYAGVLQATTTIDPAVAEQAAQPVLTAFSPTHRFGFQHIDDCISVDDPGFLTGAAGVALALTDLAEVPAPRVATRWDALLLLS